MISNLLLFPFRLIWNIIVTCLIIGGFVLFNIILKGVYFNLTFCARTVFIAPDLRPYVYKIMGL
jgi:hypothetical protein